MRVQLVSTNTASSPYPVYPLGCSVVAEALRRAGHKTRFFDCNSIADGHSDVDSTLADLEKEFRSFQPELIGISIRNIDNVNVLEEETFLDLPRRVVETAREALPGVPVVLGGSGYSIMPEALLYEIGADYGVAGEGERAVLELAEALKKGVPPPVDPAGIIRASESPLRDDSILGAEYILELAKRYNAAGCVMPLQTKRGCSNKCVYCTYPFLEGRKLRGRPSKEVIADIRRLRDEFGADMIFFTDSVFNDSTGNYLTLVEAMEKEGLEFPWTAFFQPDPGLTPEIVDRLADTGLQSVELGPDATSDITLKAIGKHFNFEEVFRCNELFANKSIAVANYFMMGVPSETEETAKKGVENIRCLDRSVSFVFLGVRILPGTPLLELAVREGVIGRNTPLVDPVYYFSQGVNREWLEEYLDETLGKMKHCVYPPNSMDAGIRILRQMGYRGNLWEMMVKDSKRLPRHQTTATLSESNAT